MLPIDLQILKYYFFEKPIYYYKIKDYFKTPAYKQLYQTLSDYQPDEQLLTSPLADTNFTIFDLETTGLIPEVGHEVISIGAIQLRGFQYCRVKRFHKIIDPIRPVPKRVAQLTGIDHRMINHAPSFIEIFNQFLEFSQNSILVAHPAKFDMRFLQTMLKRWKLPVYQPFVIDSQLMAKWLIPDTKYQLDELIRHFNIEQLERHHALNDAIMTAELFEKLLKQALNQDIDSYQQLQTKLLPFKQQTAHTVMRQHTKDWS